MPSPIFHTAVGYALSHLPLAQRQRSRWLSGTLSEKMPGRLLPAIPLAAVYGIFVSNLPDLDFIPQLLTGLRFHRGPSHSLLGAVLVSALLALIIRSRRTADPQASAQAGKRDRNNPLFIRLFILTFLFYGIHLFMDFFSAGGNGMRLLWPLSEQFFKSPIALFPQVHYDRSWWDASHLTFISVELLYSLCVLSVLKAVKARNHSVQTDISSH
jgi:inner membrane protein